MNKLLLVLILFFSLSPSLVSAQLDPRCFTEKACNDARAALVKESNGQPSEATGGFVKDSGSINVCGEKDSTGKNDLGFCLPAGKTVTEISFGGRTQFAHLGDFIKYMYRYAIIVAGILATIIIITAGFQWLTSGGNSEGINSAKKRIWSALMGLLLAAGSYMLLNTINPNLVNLRLPQVWLVNQQSLVPALCSDAATGSKFAPAYKQGEQISSSEILKRYESVAQYKFDNSTDAESGGKPPCGSNYFVANPQGQGSGPQTCLGIVCPNPNSICMPTLSNLSVSSCRPGAVGGTVRANESFICSDLNTIIDNDLQLIAMCNNGDLEKVTEINAQGQQNSIYVFPPTNSIATICKEKNGLAGFYLGAEINDEGGGLTGNFCPGASGSSGCDDWHAIGKDSKNSHNCSTNLATLGYGIMHGRSPGCGGESGVDSCSCGAISDETIVKTLAGNSTFTDHLLTLEELQKGFLCNITINRSEFPALENAGGIIIPDCTAFTDATRCFRHQ